MPRKIVMIGSDLAVRGGVSAMVNVCVAQGLFERWDAVYLGSHCDGTAWQKLRQALRAWFKFMAMLLRREVALLHVHLNSDASFWRKAAFVVPARMLGVPYVLQVHCGHFVDFYRERLKPRGQRFLRGMLRDATRVVALSEGARAALTFIEPGLEMDVVPNPVAVPAWQAPLTQSPPTVLFLGMIREAKGVFDLLRAWPTVLEAMPDARLVLAGVGEVERARAIARENGFEASLVMPGWIGGEEKERLLRDAWVFALPSHWEALPMSVLESMAAGVPVVASRVGGIPDTVVEGETGLLVEPRDINRLAAALVTLLRDEQRRLEMGAAGRARAREHFSAEVVVPRLEAVWSAHGAPRARPPHGQVELAS
jgi:glycosyltransferase involved in cell wall biosynthesis